MHTAIYRPGNVDDWLKIRRNYLGASDAPAAIGQSPWVSKYALWAEKVGEIPPADLSGNDAVYWGNVLEEPIRKEIGERLDQEIRHDGPWTILVSEIEDCEFMSATLDGMATANRQVLDLFEQNGLRPPKLGTSGTVQIKTTSAYHSSDWKDLESWPLHYQVQCQHELLVSDFDWGILGVLIGGQKFKMIPFYRNETFLEALLKMERSFWDLVVSKTAPDIDDSESTYNAVRQRFKVQTEDTVELPKDSLIWDMQLVETQNQIKELKKAERKIKARFIEAIGNFSAGIVPDPETDDDFLTKYTYRETTTRRIKSDKVKELYPDIVDEVTEVSSHRTLRRGTVNTPKSKKGEK